MFTLLQKLEMLPSSEIPYLLFTDEDGCSVLDLMVKSSQQRSSAMKYNIASAIERLLQIMINCDQRGILYQNVLQRNLIRLFKTGIDLKPYFGSQMPMFKIEHPDFPQYHLDARESITSSNEKCIDHVIDGHESLFRVFLAEGIEDDID